MRLLFVEHHPVFGGPHNRAIRLAAPLEAAGWQTTVLLPDEPGTAAARCAAAGLDVVTIPLNRPRRSPRRNLEFLARFAGDVSRIARVVQERAIDAIIVAGLESPHGALAG